jgi:hypothetical protein
MGGRTLLFVNAPGAGQRATTTIWMAFDSPQTRVEYRPVSSGRATVRVTRYRW